MRALKHLIPDDARNSLNANPVVQWVVIVLMVVVGTWLVVKGVNGVKNKTLTGKNGRVFEGATAQVLGVVYTVLGFALAATAVVMKFAA